MPIQRLLNVEVTKVIKCVGTVFIRRVVVDAKRRVPTVPHGAGKRGDQVNSFIESDYIVSSIRIVFTAIGATSRLRASRKPTRQCS